MRILVPALLFALLSLLVLRGLSPQVIRGRVLAGILATTAVVYALFVAARFDLLPPMFGVIGLTWSVASVVIVLVGTPLLIVKRVHAFARRRAPASPDLGRRRFFAGVLPATALATGAKGSADGLSTDFVVKQQEFVVNGLPAALDGFRIGHITDVHIGDFIDPAYLARAVRTLDDAGVDLQVMTGDLIDDVSQLEPTLDALEATRAQYGMLAILGNHEKWRGEERIVKAYRRREPRGKLRLLIDESLTIDHAGATLRIVGVDWPSVGTRRRVPPQERAERMKRSAEIAFAGVKESEAVLCLSHHPDFFPLACERGASLTLAGHTHGGQVALLGFPIFSAAFDHMLGRYERDGRHLYVGGGTGHWMPFRLGVPAEITVVTLRSA